MMNTNSDQNQDAEIIENKLNLSDKTILIIENDSVAVLLLNEYLSVFNVKTITIDNNEALNLKNYKNIDLIIKGVSQAEFRTGLEIVKRIIYNFREIPIFAHSACNKFDLELLLEIGCNEFIPKPYQFDYLEGLLKKYFSK